LLKKQKKTNYTFFKAMFFSIYEAALQRNQALIISVKELS
jgi:hypothetical protein